MRLRRTKLYLPGNNPNMLLRGHLFEPDGVILDLEDAVALSEKDTARILIQQVLKRGEFGECEVTVRVNGMDTDLWRQDIEAVLPWAIPALSSISERASSRICISLGFSTLGTRTP